VKKNILAHAVARPSSCHVRGGQLFLMVWQNESVYYVDPELLQTQQVTLNKIKENINEMFIKRLY
jgi:hypothetical protein